MPQVNKQWSRMSQEEREAALLAQAAEHRGNHPAGKGRGIDYKTSEDGSVRYRKRRKYERHDEEVQADRRPGVGVLTVSWVMVLVAAQIPVPIIAITLYALTVWNAVRILRGRRLGNVGKFFTWALLVQVAWSVTISTIMAWPIIGYLFGALTLQAPVMQ